MHASMVCVTAAAFAIDALHSDIAPLVGRDPDPRSKGGRQWAYFLKTFGMATPAASRWQQDLEWLFGLRDNAVHFQGVSQQLVWHEDLGTNIAPENVSFAVESAERAVAFVLEVFRGVFWGQSASPSGAADWGAARGHVLTELEALRSA